MSNWTCVRVGSSRARADVGLADDPRNRLSAVPAVRPARARAAVRARGRGAAQAWLAGAAIAIQIGIVSIFPGDLGPLGEPLHILSYLLLGAFAWANRRIAGLPIVALGGLLNFVCITVNGGVMPADPDALAAIGRSPTSDEFINSTALAHPKLAFLGDIIPTPASWPVSNVYSVGDLLILTGRLRAAARGLRLAARAAALPAPAGDGGGLSPCCGRPSRTLSSRRFFGAHAQSCLGSGLAYVALPLLAYDRFGSAWAVVAVLLPDLLPAVVLGPLRRRARGPLGLAHVRAARRRHPLPGLPAAAVRLEPRADDRRRRARGRRHRAVRARRAGGPARSSRRATGGPAAMGLFGALDDLGLTLGPALAAALLFVTLDRRPAGAQRGLVRRQRPADRGDPRRARHRQRSSAAPRCSPRPAPASASSPAGPRCARCSAPRRPRCCASA